MQTTRKHKTKNTIADITFATSIGIVMGSYTEETKEAFTEALKKDRDNKEVAKLNELTKDKSKDKES